jgi:hypothetical protein
LETRVYPQIMILLCSGQLTLPDHVSWHQK